MTHKGIEIVVRQRVTERYGVLFQADNNSGEPRNVHKWFHTREEAVANEKREIDNMLS